MIIRSLRLRHGRLALPRSIHLSRRSLASTSNTPQFQTASTPVTINGLEIRDPNHPVAQDYIFFHHQKSHTSHLGHNDSKPHYQPHQLLSSPPSPADITLELLMASQTHIGHATSLWNPSNAKYIFGVRGREDPIHIISLDVTAAYLRRACKIVSGVTSRGGLVLFVGTRAGQARTVVRAAQLAVGCHLFTKWIPGSITNGNQILATCGKKVVDEKDVEVLGFGDQLEKSAALKPDLVVCLNPLENYVLLHECGLHNIPTIGIIDTDANPTWVTYPIPANDDSLRAVQVICGALGRAGEEGQATRWKMAREGVVASLPRHGLQAPRQGQAHREKEAREREALLAEERVRAYIEAGEIVEGEGLGSLGQDDGEGYADGELDGSLQEAERGNVESEAIAQPYERDRPLSAEELAQASESAEEDRRLADWEVEGRVP